MCAAGSESNGLRDSCGAGCDRPAGVSLSSFLAAHGPHVAELAAPVAWIGWVIVRERRRHPVPDPGRPAPGGGTGAARPPGAACPPGGTGAADRPGGMVVGVATVLVVLATIGAACVHASIAPEHYSEGLIYGLFFTGLAAGQLTLAGIIAWKRDPRVVAVIAAGDVATLALWLLTRLVGIPGGPLSGTREAFGGRDILASALEAVTVAAALVVLHRRAPTGSRRGPHLGEGSAPAMSPPVGRGARHSRAGAG